MCTVVQKGRRRGVKPGRHPTATLLLSVGFCGMRTAHGSTSTNTATISLSAIGFEWSAAPLE